LIDNKQFKDEAYLRLGRLSGKFTQSQTRIITVFIEEAGADEEVKGEKCEPVSLTGLINKQ
jgi:hypothetical protein